jgi:hypothetical protein
MKFYTYIKETIKNNLSHRSFQKKLRLWNLDQMIIECSRISTLWYNNVDDYDFFLLKIFLPLKIYLG